MKADLAHFLAEHSLSFDDLEEMAHLLFENSYLDRHKPNEKSTFGYHLSESELYSLAKRFHKGEDNCTCS